MNMKFCPNYGCVAYGRVVYTQATRCAFCRWDLKPPRMKSETVEASPPPAKNAEGWGTPSSGMDDAPVPPQPRAHARRHALRPSA